MLKRIYVDNYKSLVNFEFKPGPINLLLGPNGAGKSAVFEVVKLIRDLVGGQGRIIADLFQPESLTRWQSSPYQTFELEIAHGQDIYKYEFSIEYHTEPLIMMRYERLSWNNRPLLAAHKGIVDVFIDDRSTEPTLPFIWPTSVIPLLAPNNFQIAWFKKYLENLLIIRPIPTLMVDESAQEDRLPSIYMKNFVSWYRYLSQDQGFAMRLTSELKEVLPGFEYFKFEQFGEKHRLLKAVFSAENGKGLIEYRLSELSDGQRMLIALYTLLHAAQSDNGQPGTLLIDEPENFIALPEIQPWLTTLYDLCNENKTQALLISHHPELINYLLASPVGYWFERESNRPTHLKPITLEAGEGLPASELVARGWL